MANPQSVDRRLARRRLHRLVRWLASITEVVEVYHLQSFERDHIPHIWTVRTRWQRRGLSRLDASLCNERDIQLASTAFQLDSVVAEIRLRIELCELFHCERDRSRLAARHLGRGDQ